MDMSTDFEGEYLSAKSYEEGSRLVLTIKDARKAEFEDRKTGKPLSKWVLYFNEEEKGIVINPGNGKVLVQLFGQMVNGRVRLETKELIGKRVAFIVTSSPVGMYFKLMDKQPKESQAAI